MTGTYIYFLLARGGILLEPREVSVAFENAGIQVDLTLSSQFLPGQVWELYAAHIGKLGCQISTRIDDTRLGYTQRNGASHPLLYVHFGGDGTGHKITNGLTRTDVWKVEIDDIDFDTLRDGLWAMRSHFQDHREIAINVDYE